MVEPWTALVKAPSEGMLPLTWMRGNYGILIMCPNRHFGSLLKHEISDEGIVTPSVQCYEPECDWHVYIKLDGYAVS